MFIGDEIRNEDEERSIIVKLARCLDLMDV